MNFDLHVNFDLHMNVVIHVNDVLCGNGVISQPPTYIHTYRHTFINTYIYTYDTVKVAFRFPLQLHWTGLKGILGRRIFLMYNISLGGGYQVCAQMHSLL